MTTQKDVVVVIWILIGLCSVTAVGVFSGIMLAKIAIYGF